MEHGRALFICTLKDLCFSSRCHRDSKLLDESQNREEEQKGWMQHRKTREKVFSSLTTGPRSMKMKRVGTGTSVKSPKTTGWTSRMKAETGFSRQSTSPTRTFEASAPAGIFFKNDVFP